MAKRRTNAAAEKALKTIISPVDSFLKMESASGILLMIATAVAMIWANSSYYESYKMLVEMPVGFSFGDFALQKTLHHWVNDGLMVIFFFLVGLEIKRELVIGELSTPRKAALPMLAAIGGMVIPALIYTVFNHGQEGASGWGIPMATDIAFAVGVMTLLSRKVPFALKVFLLAVAIVDDLGAVLVIAFFYTEEIATNYLGMSVVFLGLIYILRASGVGHRLVFLTLSLCVWFTVLKSGIHATIAGVILGFLTPIAPIYLLKELPDKARELLDNLKRETEKEEGNPLQHSHEAEANLHTLHHYVAESTSPLEKTLHMLHPWVSFLIMPVFAFVNAGVRIEGMDMMSILQNPISIGVILGLVVGKPLGVLGASYLAVKFKLADLPGGVNWQHMTAVGFMAGIGFTMALFISHLALKSPEIEVFSKLGILGASAIASVVGIVCLATCKDVTAKARKGS